MKIEKYVERVESGNVQTKNSKVEKIYGINNDFFLKDLRVQRKIYRGHDKNALSSLLESSFLREYCLTWWRKQNNYMFCQN
jgi:hypothetical protein